MGDIGKPLKRIVLVPMPDDVPVPEIVPVPVPEPERDRPREPARVG